MKDRGFTTVDSRKMSKVFTLLATACYRASDGGMAVGQATAFLDEMKEKGSFRVISSNHHLSTSAVGFRIEYRTFNAFIAAFGKHGQLKMAFQLADEMVEVGFVPNEDTYASLLIACSSEKVAGFKYAIEVRLTVGAELGVDGYFVDMAPHAGFRYSTKSIPFWSPPEYHSSMWPRFTGVHEQIVTSSTTNFSQ